jgi:hypothetical protein
MTALATGPCYVFGLVPLDEVPADGLPDLRPEPDGASIGAVRLVPADRVAVVVGSVPEDRPLGRAADLRAHDRVLAGLVAAGVTVLPFRFGSVVADDRAVVDELVRPHAAEFADALEQVRGCVQYTVRARYEQDSALREVLARHPEIEALRDRTGEGDVAGRLRLGELVVRALEHMRPADADALIAELEPHARSVRVREPESAEGVLNAAALVDRARSAAFENAVEGCGRDTAGRIRIRLIGPIAPYDFVPER